MTLNEILKEILDNIPKTDFKEIYAGGLYRRLEKETDPDVKKLFQEKIYSIQITDENIRPCCRESEGSSWTIGIWPGDQ